MPVEPIMPVEDCPSRDAIRDYSVGKLDDERSRQLADHLDACPDCQAELETFDDVNDTLLGGLRAQAEPDPVEGESQLSAALARAHAVGDPDAEADIPAGKQPLGFLPRELGEYQLLERLGQGGMGTVYKALHTKLDRVVALKVLATGRMAEHRAVARFEREMKAIGGLDHPGIVRAFDAREIDGLPVLIMECLEGMDLARAVRRLGRVPVAEACEIARQAASALQYAHENGLVHRDVKPSNLMLTPQGRVKLLDLGLARWHLDGSASAESKGETTATGQAMGTADYMAPEQVADSHTADIRSDIYSLGCTLYKLITGRAPFAEPEYQGTYEKMTAHVEQPVRPIRELAPEVPEPLAQIIDRMLAKSPTARFDTPEEVGRVLEPFCDQADLCALSARAEEAEALQDTDGRSRATAGSRGIIANSPLALPGPMESWFRRHPKWLLLGMLGPLAAAIALGIIIVIQRDGKQTKLDVPPGANVTFGNDGNVVVDLDGKSPTANAVQKGPAPPANAAREDAAVTIPIYRIKPLDFLKIEVRELVPKEPYKVGPNDVLAISTEDPRGGPAFARQINAKGELDLRWDDGTFSVVGMSIAEIQTAVNKAAPKSLQDRKFSVRLVDLGALSEISGQYLVGFDGRINLRRYGTVDVAGKTAPQATEAVKEALSKQFKSVELSVDEVADDRRTYYHIIITGEGEDRDQITKRPYAGTEAVFDAIGHVEESISRLSKKHLWIARPADNPADTKILPIDLEAIIRGDSKTNYQLLRDDRLFISDSPYDPSGVNGSPKVTPTKQSDHKAIQGTWKVVSHKQGKPSSVSLLTQDVGKSPSFPWIKPAETLESTTIVISEKSVLVRGKPIPSQTCQYQINPETDPKWIELLVDGKGKFGLYELQGNRLNICLDWDGKRPDTFWVELGSHREELVLQRVGPAVVNLEERAIQGTWEVVEAQTNIMLDPSYRPNYPSSAQLYAVPYGKIAPGRKIMITDRELKVFGVPEEEVAKVTLDDTARQSRRPPPLLQPLARNEVFEYLLGPLQKPARIDLTRVIGRSPHGPDSSPCPGVYRLDGDRLTIRLGEKLPTKVDAPAADGEVLLVLKRVSPAPSEPADNEHAGPATDGNTAGDSGEESSFFGSPEGWRLLSVAASWEKSAFDKMTTATTMPSIDTFKNRPLTLAVLTMPMISETQTQRHLAEFQMLGKTPQPAKLAKALLIVDKNMPRNVVSIIQPRYIKRVNETQNGDRIVGHVEFEAKGVYRGKIEFLAERTKDNSWQVTEFRLPAYQRAVIRQPDQQWKVRRLAQPADDTTEEVQLTIDVDADGRARLDGVTYDDAKSLAAAVKKRKGPNVNVSIRLRADMKTPHKHVVALLDALKEISVTDVSLQTSKARPEENK